MESCDIKCIGKKIKIYRKSMNIKQENLAQSLNISRTHLSDIERGAKFPTLKTLIKITNILGITADMLLCDCFNIDDIQTSNEIFESIKSLTTERRTMIFSILQFFIENEDVSIKTKQVV